MKKVKSIFIILLPILLGGVVGFLARNDFSYINDIPHNIKIPGIVFMIVWPVLYLLMGFWTYLNWKEDEDKLLTIFWISLLFNLAYTPVFFTFHRIIISLIIVLCNLISICYLYIKDNKKSKYLLIPYLLWLGVALVLMIDIVICNFFLA